MTLAYSGLALRTPLPASVQTPSPEGLRRSSEYSGEGNWNYNSIWMDWTATEAVSLEANKYGVITTVPTVPGKTYTLRGSLKWNYATQAEADAGAKTFSLFWQKTSTTMSLGTSASAAGKVGSTVLAAQTFVATEDFSTVGVLIRNAFSATAGKQLANVGVFAMMLEEAEPDVPQRLRNTTYDGSLASHFDLACNSVGATWHVDAAGVTQILPPVKELPVSFVFSDEEGSEFLEYIDLEPLHATASIVNQVEVTNLGMQESTQQTWTDTSSISKYGVRKESLTVNLSEWMLNPGLDDLRRKLMAPRAIPRLAINKIVWNAQQDIRAAQRMEIGQRVLIRFRGEEYDAQIAALEHEITPTRWLVTISLRLP